MKRCGACLCAGAPAASPIAPGMRLEGANDMNAYVLIAGLSGVAVFCAVALKSFGGEKR